MYLFLQRKPFSFFNAVLGCIYKISQQFLVKGKKIKSDPQHRFKKIPTLTENTTKLS